VQCVLVERGRDSREMNSEGDRNSVAAVVAFHLITVTRFTKRTLFARWHDPSMLIPESSTLS